MLIVDVQNTTRNGNKFLKLKNKGGNVIFGDSQSAKILGKRTVSLGNKNTKA